MKFILYWFTYLFIYYKIIKHIILLFTFIFTFIYSQDIQKFAELSALKHCPFLNFNGFTCPIKTPISENNINIIGGLGFSTIQQTTKLPIYKSEKAVEIYEEKYEYSEFNKVSGPKSIINHRKLLKQLNNLFIIMKSRDVLKILQISRSTLYHYVRDRKIFVTKLDNGYYDYDEDCIFKLLKKDSRYNVIYARVSTYKQKNDLSNQVTFIQDYCKNNNIVIETIYSEISSGIDLDRIEFNKLMDLVIHMKIKNIYISNKDRFN